MQAVYVIANRHKDQGLRCAREMVQRLHERKIQVYAPDEIAAELGVQTAAFSQEEGCEAAFVLGGDGTILRAVQRLSILQTPMVGLNLGSLGFLTEASQGAMPEIVDKVLGRAYSVESRMMLTAHIEEKTGQVVSREYYALNEFGLFRRYMGGVASVVVRYQNQVVGMYDCDGVMVATPTGSTAYSLSAGGPVVDPQVQCMLITPVCAHSLNARPFVVPDNGVVTLAAPTTRQGVMVAVDDAFRMPVMPSQHVVIRKSEKKANFIRLSEMDFYKQLGKKLTQWNHTSAMEEPQ